MAFVDNLKDLANKAQGAVSQNHDKIHSVIDKAASTADQRTGGKYSDQLNKVSDKAKSTVSNVAANSGQDSANGAAEAPVDGTVVSDEQQPPATPEG
ncbi:MAG: antitoxin [Solirubrobacterales bacterium]|nr:antitoxin [Solirubrobacterales bacterium]